MPDAGDTRYPNSSSLHVNSTRKHIFDPNGTGYSDQVLSMAYAVSPDNYEMPMQFGEVLQKRHSIRQLRDTEIPVEIVAILLRAAQAAPSAGNLQAYNIAVFAKQTSQSPDYESRREALTAACSNQSVARNAPLMLVFIANRSISQSKYGARGRDLYSLQDATIAASFTELSATALGLGCTWLGAIDSSRILGKNCLDIEGDSIVVAVLAIGYPDEETTPERRRRPLGDIVDKWIV